MYIPEQKTERIKLLREMYKTCPVATGDGMRYLLYSGDRAVSMGYMEGWLKNIGAPTTQLRRSLAEASELDSYRPVIQDHELVVGQIDFPAYTEQEQKRFDELYKMMHMSGVLREGGTKARADHIGLDYEKLLRVGVNGLIAEIEERKAALSKTDPGTLYNDENICKQEFYDCCLIELKAVLRLAERYAAHAAALAEAAEEPRRSELLEISRNLQQVPANPARTFYEAVQSVHFYTFNMFGLYPLGRPDRYLYPFYRRDIDNGTLTVPRAQELIDNLCLLISTYVVPRAANGFIVGGYDRNGKLVENELTYMFVTALDHVRMPDPNGAIAVNADTGKELLSHACDILGEGVSHPAFYNDELIINAMKNYGIAPEDACEYIHVTCAELSPVGCARMYTTPFEDTGNLPALLVSYLRENTVNTFDELVDGFFEMLRSQISDHAREYALKILEASRNGVQSMRASCLVNDCVAKGKSVYQDGARYSFLLPVFIGFSNFCDSMVALKTLVFEEGKLTVCEFLEILDSNYEKNMPLRQYILHKLPHYGNDDERVDSLAAMFADRIRLIFHDSNVYAASRSIPGTFSYLFHAIAGSKTGATFDGRLAGTSLADGCCPVQGMDTHGPTATVNSLTGWDQSAFLGGMVVNLKLSKSNFDQRKKETLLDIIRAFITRGGIELQVNTVDKATLLDAVEHPERHGDLLVRIGGFSDYFVRQNAVTQQEIIARTEH